MNHIIYRVTAILLCLFLFSGEPSIAQSDSSTTPNALGVTWVVPESNQIAKKQLKLFSSLGFTYLQINQKLPAPIWDTIASLNYNVFALLPVRYPVTHTFSHSDSSFKKQLKAMVRYYQSHPSIKSIGLFAYGLDQQTAFKKAAYNVYQPLLGKTNYPAYYISSHSSSLSYSHLVSVKLSHKNKSIRAREIKGYLLPPNKASKIRIHSVKKVLTSDEGTNLIFIRSPELLSIISAFPTLKKTFKQYSSPNSTLLILPETATTLNTENSVIILLLLLTWLICATTYFRSPIFKKAFYRYFLAHRFFVKDVFQRHTRTMLPGTSILIQNSILAGIIFYCIGNSLFSSLGRDALFYWFPYLGVFGQWPWSFFIWGAVIVLLLETLFIIYIWLINSKITHLSQIFNLFLWPLQLNIFIVTIAATIFVSGGSEVLLYMLGVLFVAVFSAAFVITSFDTIHFLPKKKRVIPTALTTGLFATGIIGLILWIVLSPRLLSIIELATGV